MTAKKTQPACTLCGADRTTEDSTGAGTCPTCRVIIDSVKQHPDIVRRAWLQYQDEPIFHSPAHIQVDDNAELPDVLDGKRYRTIDRDHNKWYLSISEVEGLPVEVFASTAFDRDHELQSRISNLTTITRLISLILRHVVIGERITLEKCLKQLQRSSRQKNDLPDMLYNVLKSYEKNDPQKNQTLPSSQEAA